MQTCGQGWDAQAITCSTWYQLMYIGPRLSPVTECACTARVQVLVLKLALVRPCVCGVLCGGLFVWYQLTQPDWIQPSVRPRLLEGIP